MEELFSYVKGELEREEEGIYKLEVADTNRPDLFTIEGIARELEGIFRGKSLITGFGKGEQNTG